MKVFVACTLLVKHISFKRFKLFISGIVEIPRSNLKPESETSQSLRTILHEQVASYLCLQQKHDIYAR